MLNSIEQGTRWARFETRDRHTRPRLARQVRTFLLGLAAHGAFGRAGELQACEVVCDDRVNDELDLVAGQVHCLVALPATRAGEFHSYMITHRLEGTTVRSVKSRMLPEGTRFTVHAPAPARAGQPVAEAVGTRRTLAQELFAPAPEMRLASTSPTASAGLDPVATAPRRLDLNLIARVYGDPVRRGERF